MSPRARVSARREAHASRDAHTRVRRLVRGKVATAKCRAEFVDIARERTPTQAPSCHREAQTLTGIDAHRIRVIHRRAIEAPLPHVARHVVEPEGIPRERADRCPMSEAIVEVRVLDPSRVHLTRSSVGQVRSAIQRLGFGPGPPRCIRSCAHAIFPPDSVGRSHPSRVENEEASVQLT